MSSNWTIAEFRCFDDNVKLTRTAEHRYEVDATWRDHKGNLVLENHNGLNLREARIQFEKLVNLAICRMTLDRMYSGVGQETPRGNGKYGLPE